LIAYVVWLTKDLKLTGAREAGKEAPPRIFEFPLRPSEPLWLSVPFTIECNKINTRILRLNIGHKIMNQFQMF